MACSSVKFIIAFYLIHDNRQYITNLGSVCACTGNACSKCSVW